MQDPIFKSKIFILPGLGNSEDTHWQSLWENRFNFERIQQRDWETPICSEWIETIDKKIREHRAEDVILVGHSLACCTISFWASQYKRKIKGALLVAPSDTEADTYPPGTSGFTPMPINPLPFPSITVVSTDDFYVSIERANHFAKAWKSELINIGHAGHINVEAGFGAWNDGLEILLKLDKL